MPQISEALFRDIHYFLISHSDKSFPGDSHITASDLHQRLQDETIWNAKYEGTVDKNIIK